MRFHCSLEVDMRGSGFKLELDWQRAEGVVSPVSQVEVVYEFFRFVAQEFHVRGTTQGVVDKPPGLWDR
jgi:hypothetical protein